MCSNQNLNFKIALCNLPPTFFKSSFSFSKVPSFALAILSTYLEVNSYPVDVYDFNFYDEKNLWIPYPPETMNFYVMDIPHLVMFIKLIQQFRSSKSVDQLIYAYNNTFQEFDLYCNEINIPLTVFYTIYKNIEEEIGKIFRILYKYDVVAFSTTYLNLFNSFLCATLLKTHSPKIKIVFGGPQVTQSHGTRRLLLKSGIANAIVVGEGEVTFLNLLREFKLNQNGYDIPGVMSFQNNKGFIYTPRQEPINLDSLPCPSFDKFDLNKYTPFVLPLYLSRGCLYRCRYCSEHSLLGPFRTRSINKVIQDIELLSQKYRTKHFVFVDSLLNASNNYLEKFAQELIKKNINIDWSGYFTANINTRLSRKLKQVGLSKVTVGVESFSVAVLNNMNKKRSRKNNPISSIRIFLLNDISVIVNLIIGYPGETEDMFNQTIQNVRNLTNKYKNNLAIKLKPIEIRSGSYIFNNPKTAGIKFSFWKTSLLKNIDGDLKIIMKTIPFKFSLENLKPSDIIYRRNSLNYLLSELRPKVLLDNTISKAIAESIDDNDLIVLNKEKTLLLKANVEFVNQVNSIITRKVKTVLLEISDFTSLRSQSYVYFLNSAQMVSEKLPEGFFPLLNQPQTVNEIIHFLRKQNPSHSRKQTISFLSYLIANEILYILTYPYKMIENKYLL